MDMKKLLSIVDNSGVQQKAVITESVSAPTVSKTEQYFKAVNNEVLQNIKEQQVQKKIEVKRVVSRVLDRLEEGKTTKDKPAVRNFVAKNAPKAGAGPHKDKKKAEKQGDTKHKKELVPMDEERTEVRDKDGKVTSWKDEGEWKKSTANKDGRGKVTNLSDKARRETEKLSKKERNVAEGVMSEIHMELSDIVAREDFDALYDLFSANTPTGRYVQDMVDDVVVDYRLHPDDDFEKIEEIVFNRLEEEFGDQGVAEVAGAQKCWPGHKKVGTQPGTGKNAGKRVNDCEKIEEDEVEESGLQYYTGVKKHGEKYMKKAAAAGRDGASQKELGALKDKYSKAYKNDEVEEAAKKGLYYYVNKRKAAGTSRPASSPKAPTAQAWKDAAKTAKKENMAEGRFGKDAYERDYDSSIAGMDGSSHREFKRQEMEHELGHETNNYAVAINGKTWKVFGTRNHAESIARKIQMRDPGKKVSVHETGAPVSEQLAESAYGSVKVGSPVKVYSNVLKKSVFGKVVDLKEGRAYVQYNNTKIVMGHPISEVAAAAPTAKVAGSVGGKLASRLIPGVGAAVGAYDAYDRATKGDYIGAGLSGLGAVTSLIPGVGTAATMGLAGAQLARDYKVKTGVFAPDDAGQAATPAAGKGTIPNPTKYPTTPDEIKAFQQAKGLTVDGVIGKNTRTALAAAGIKPPAQAATPAPSSNVGTAVRAVAPAASAIAQQALK